MSQNEHIYYWRTEGGGGNLKIPFNICLEIKPTFMRVKWNTF